MEALELAAPDALAEQASAEPNALATDAVLRPGPGEAEAADELIGLIDVMLGGDRPARLLSPEGHEVDVPTSALAGLRQVAAALARGQGVTVAQHDRELTTQEAADLLHMSRPHLIKLLDQGELTHHRTSEGPGSHRRLLLDDVLAYREQRKQARRSLLRELTQSSQNASGGYR